MAEFILPVEKIDHYSTVFFWVLKKLKRKKQLILSNDFTNNYVDHIYPTTIIIWLSDWIDLMVNMKILPVRFQTYYLPTRYVGLAKRG